ncbi:hypothetical protein [Microcystis phage Mae-JY30]
MTEATKEQPPKEWLHDVLKSATEIDREEGKLPFKGGVEAATDEIEEALKAPATAPIFTTHSDGLAGEINAKAVAFKAMVAEVDAKIAALEAEREDLMLAYSMLSHAMTARETGRRN